MPLLRRLLARLLLPPATVLGIWCAAWLIVSLPWPATPAATAIIPALAGMARRSSIQHTVPAGTAWTALAGPAEYAGMGYRHPRYGRDLLMGSPSDALGLYVSHYQLAACCRRPSCGHRRDLHTDLLLRFFGADATLGAIAARLRCHRCGVRGAKIEVRFVGPTGDGR